MVSFDRDERSWPSWSDDLLARRDTLADVGAAKLLSHAPRAAKHGRLCLVVAIVLIVLAPRCVLMFTKRRSPRTGGLRAFDGAPHVESSAR